MVYVDTVSPRAVMFHISVSVRAVRYSTVHPKQ
jgi:hypothetical protein